jgi:catechol 2,3-dioxygenase-like lactoylglutathione lyase family enzyme
VQEEANTGASACLGTNHVGLTVRSLDRLVSFFRDCLGFNERDRGVRDAETARRITGLAEAAVNVVYMDGPGLTVELIEYTAPLQKSVVTGRPCDAGNTHLAFNVSGIDRIVLLAKRFGFQPMGEVVEVMQGPNTGRRALYLKDNDQIIVELIGT